MAITPRQRMPLKQPMIRSNLVSDSRDFSFRRRTIYYCKQVRPKKVSRKELRRLFLIEYTHRNLHRSPGLYMEWFPRLFCIPLPQTDLSIHTEFHAEAHGTFPF